MVKNSIKNWPLQPEEIQGTYTALITPMIENEGAYFQVGNKIDYKKLEMLISDQVDAGVDGFVVLGTTAQSASFSGKEHREVVSNIYNIIRANHGVDIQVIIGAGSNDTQTALKLMAQIENDIGHSTFLHATGHYNKPTQDGLSRHFEYLAHLCPKSNILLYNVPGRTNLMIDSETVVNLSKIEGIVGIKDASSNLEHVKKIIDNTDPEKFVVLSGEDHLVSPIMKMGGKGVISASANIAPSYFVGITHAALHRNYGDADMLQTNVNRLVKEGVFYKTNPIPLAHMFDTALRLPLLKLSNADDEIIRKVVMHYSPSELGIDIKKYNPRW